MLFRKCRHSSPTFHLLVIAPPSPETPAHDCMINLTGEWTDAAENKLAKSECYFSSGSAPGQWTAVPVSLPVTKHRDVTSKEMGTLRLWGQVHSSARVNSLWTHSLACTGMEPELKDTEKDTKYQGRKAVNEHANKWNLHLLETVLFSNPLKTLLNLREFCETNTISKKTNSYCDFM